MTGAQHVSIASPEALKSPRERRSAGSQGVRHTTGWRIGYAAGPKAFADRRWAIFKARASDPCSISQRPWPHCVWAIVYPPSWWRFDRQRRLVSNDNPCLVSLPDADRCVPMPSNVSGDPPKRWKDQPWLRSQPGDFAEQAQVALVPGERSAASHPVVLCDLHGGRLNCGLTRIRGRHPPPDVGGPPRLQLHDSAEIEGY